MNMMKIKTSLALLTRKEPKHASEREFVKNFFDHDDWEYEPRAFVIKGMGRTCRYYPDFYDARRDIFIEVSSRRSAYLEGKERYMAFREQYPNLQFEIRNPDGTIHNENPDPKIQAYEIERECPSCGRKMKGNGFFHHIKKCSRR